MDLQKNQIDVLLRVFDDLRALIAALKLQRWEVVKWAATLNIALAAASASFEKAQPAIFACSVVVAGFGVGLLWFYNHRLTQVRARWTLLHDFIRANVINLLETTGLTYASKKGTEYDRTEMKLYTFVVVSSTFPALLVWSI